MSLSCLFLSPHLDDVAFSCGGTVAACVRGGHSASICTIFTASVPDPKGFALACQLDKGLDESVDYLSLRRHEDREFAAIVGASEVIHLPFQEAPHRGYDNADALFGGVRDEDCVFQSLAGELRRICVSYDVVFAPQGIGRHVDHLQTILAVEQAGLAERTLWYREMPYTMRAPAERSSFPARVYGCIDSTLDNKIAGCGAYRSQLPFQFGSAESMRRDLMSFHESEARSGDCPFAFAECFDTSFSVAAVFAAAFGQTCVRPNSAPSS